MAGCGLGSAVITNHGWNSQSTAATTNGTFGSQSFGITTGTSNCTPDGQASATRLQQRLFVSTNLNDVEREIAQGNGSSISSLGALLGCPARSEDKLGSLLQDNYSAIFAAPGGGAVLETISNVIESDESLSTQCKQYRA